MAIKGNVSSKKTITFNHMHIEIIHYEVEM